MLPHRRGHWPGAAPGAGYITDNVLAGDLSAAPGKILGVGALLLGLVLVQALCSYFMDYQGHAIGARMERDMRAQLFAHCQRLSFSYFDSHPIGDLMSRLTNDSLSLAEFFHHVPEDVLVNSIKFVGASLILWHIHWQMTLVILCFLPFMLAYTLYFNKKMAAALEQGREDMGEINAQAEDTLSAIRMVQSFGNEAVEAQKFHVRNEKFLESRKRGYKGEALCYGGMDAFSSLIPIAVVVVGGLSILQGSLALSELVVFLLYVSYFTQPIQSLVNTSRLIQEGRTGFARYMEILETQPEVADLPGAQDLPPVKGDIRFSHVTFRYGEGDAVFRDLNLTIRAGEYVALVGASGVGKTTLCSLIPRFYDVEAGEITVDGVPIRQATLRSLRGSVGLVQQDVALFTGSVTENIAYGRPGATFQQVREAARKAGAEEFIQKLPQGYDTDIGPRGVKLSGGQRQRLSIARAFLKDPPILILDEATSALDSQSELVVQRSLEDLARHRTTLVIAHRLSTIQGAQRIVVLDENGVCEEGTHQSLMAQGGVYAKLYAASFQP